jgi:hypothetical protein
VTRLCAALLCLGLLPVVLPGFYPAHAVVDDDRGLERIGDGYVILAAPIAATDPEYQRRLPASVEVFQTGDDGKLIRVVSIHHDDDDSGSARKVARLCARLLRLHQLRFRRVTRFPKAAPQAHIWLFRDTPTGQDGAGGRTVTNNVYVFDTGHIETPLEWARTLCHEWGHLTLPAARGYKAPENDASGYLGERLFLKWLRQDRLTRAGDDFTDEPGLDLYHARQIAPLIARFHRAGPGAPALDGDDVAAMDLYIGAALATDETLGSALLGDGLYSILGTTARDFLSAVKDRAFDAPALTIALPGWAPLPPGTLTIAPTRGRGRLAIADRPPLPLTGAQPLKLLLPGWKWLRAGDGSLAEVTVRRGSG